MNVYDILMVHSTYIPGKQSIQSYLYKCLDFSCFDAHLKRNEPSGGEALRDFRSVASGVPPLLSVSMSIDFLVSGCFWFGLK